MLILALDFGTSSCRTALFDDCGRRLPNTTAQQSYSLQQDGEGKAELDSATVMKAAVTCIAETMVKQDADEQLRGESIRAVGTSCFGHSLIGADEAGRAVTPVYVWSDSRSHKVAKALRLKYREKAIHARSGCMLHSSYWPAKLRWLAQTEPKLVKRVRRWMSPAEWIYLQLCGELRVAHGMATGTGLYNPSLRSYDPVLLKLAGTTEDTLSPISDEPLQLMPAHAQSWSTLRDAQWFPAIFDGAASNLGSGATQPGLAAINVGTSAAVRILRRGNGPAPTGLFRYRVDVDRYLIGGAISNAGNLRAWCLRELKLFAQANQDSASPGQLTDESNVEKLLAEHPTPDHGLMVLPFWNVERSPAWREDDRGVVFGITEATTAIELLQAITEASYHRLATIIELIPKVDRSTRFIVGGGIQKSPSSLQRLADVLGRPLTALDEPEASLRGAAVFALEKLGASARLAPVTGHTVKPDAKRAQRYAVERKRLARLEATLFPER